MSATPAPARRLAFPETVDERAARLVATGVVALGAAFLLTGEPLVLLPLAYGFAARVAAGPHLSPLALLVTRVIVPRLGGPARPVPGPPKRFAQAIGLTCAGGALAASVLGAPGVATALIALLVVAASLEAGLGFCLGCVIFGWLQQVGVIPASVCEHCADIRGRIAAAPVGASGRAD